MVLVGSSHLTATSIALMRAAPRLVLSLAVPLITISCQDSGRRGFYGLVNLLTLKTIKHSMLVSVDYGLRVPKETLKPYEFYSVNAHASLLSRWAGAAPIHRAIENCDFELGTTLIRMAVHVDGGPNLHRKSIISFGQACQDSLVHTVSLILINVLSILLSRIVGRVLKFSAVPVVCFRRMKHKHYAVKAHEAFTFNPLRVLPVRAVKVFAELSRTIILFNMPAAYSINLEIGKWSVE